MAGCPESVASYGSMSLEDDAISELSSAGSADFDEAMKEAYPALKVTSTNIQTQSTHI